MDAQFDNWNILSVESNIAVVEISSTTCVVHAGSEPDNYMFCADDEYCDLAFKTWNFHQYQLWIT